MILKYHELILKYVTVNEAKAQFKKVLNWTDVVNGHRMRIEHLQEEMALNLRELKEKIRIAREEANNVSYCQLSYISMQARRNKLKIIFYVYLI